MTQKELKEKIKYLKSLQEEENWEKAHEEAEELVKKLFSEKKYKEIVELDKSLKCVPIAFEVAYAYVKLGDLDKGEEIYETLLSIPGEENNPAILNNLSNIKKSKGKIDEAFKLIKKAYSIASEDEIIKLNYDNLAKIIQEKEEIDSLYKNAKNNLKKETSWAIKKLNSFLNNVRKDKEFRNNKIEIPNWKFKVLIGTDELKAESLKEQWLQKGYIRDTGERGEHFAHIYEINPYLFNFLQETIPIQINNAWFEGFENINIDELKKIRYFEIHSKIKKINKRYRELIRRDFDELVFNYLVGNKKATVVLSGSLIELLFTYYCEKKKVKKISYTIKEKQVSKNLYECDLLDFLSFFDSELKSTKNVIVYIGHLSRIYRNFIHPGNEIRKQEQLDSSKINICFNAVLEITKYILK
jgi:tetratricopeptide (TPR) repeat protein